MKWIRVPEPSPAYWIAMFTNVWKKGMVNSITHEKVLGKLWNLVPDEKNDEGAWSDQMCTLNRAGVDMKLLQEIRIKQRTFLWHVVRKVGLGKCVAYWKDWGDSDREYRDKVVELLEKANTRQFWHNMIACILNCLWHLERISGDWKQHVDKLWETESIFK